MRKVALLLALAWLGGCAERDNPFDPVNLLPQPRPESKPYLWIPKPQGHVKVLLPDSSGRGGGVPYFGNLTSALSTMVPDDTLYVYGGGGEYLISGEIRITNKGSVGHPIVLIPFGGRVQFKMQPAYSDGHQLYCLRIENSHIKIRGFTFVGGEEFGIKAGEGLLADGSIDLDSVNLEHPGGGIEITNLRGPIRIHNMTIRGANQNAFPVRLIGNLGMDTGNIFW